MCLDNPESICSVCCYTTWNTLFPSSYMKQNVSFFFSQLFLLIHIFVSCFASVPPRDPAGGRLSSSGREGTEGAGRSATGTLNLTCSMDTTSRLLFSLCNWADKVPWFPLFCTSICSAWAARCILVSWKWSRVSERSGYPPFTAPVLQRSWWYCQSSGTVCRGQSSPSVLGPSHCCTGGISMHR